MKYLFLVFLLFQNITINNDELIDIINQQKNTFYKDWAKATIDGLLLEESDFTSDSLEIKQISKLIYFRKHLFETNPVVYDSLGILFSENDIIIESFINGHHPAYHMHYYSSKKNVTRIWGIPVVSGSFSYIKIDENIDVKRINRELELLYSKENGSISPERKAIFLTVTNNGILKVHQLNNDEDSYLKFQAILSQLQNYK